ncbi:MAG: TolC family protein [Thermoanaerobaculales bacterium]|nr:TolC family protein [Thermoanaerobaculales bacterium]
MRWTPLILLIALAAGGGFPAHGLTVDEAIASALVDNPSVQAAASSADADAERSQQATGHRWGRLDLAEIYTYSDNPAEVFALTLNQGRFDFDEFFTSDPNVPDGLSTWMTTLDLTLPVYTGGQIGTRVRQTATVADASAAASRHTAEQVAFDTATAFVNLAKAREHLELLGAARATTAEHVRLAGVFADQGIILASDVLEARVYLAEMDEIVERADHGARLAEATLNFHMGADQATRRELAPVPPPAPVGGSVEDWTSVAVERRRDLIAARARLEAGRLEAKAARSGALPEVAVVGRYGLYDDQIFGSNGHSGTIMALAKVNLFGGLTAGHARQAAEHDAVSFAADVRRFEEGVRLEVRQAWQDLASARARHATAREVLAAAAESLRVREQRFSQGLERMVDLLDAETSLREAETRELVARYDIALSTYRLHFVSGATLIPSMEESR